MLIFYIVGYLFITLMLIVFFINDAAKLEAREETREHYSVDEWALIVALSILWLPAIFVLLMYGILYTFFQKRIKYYTGKKIIRHRY